MTDDGHPIIYSAHNGHPSFPWVDVFPNEGKGFSVDKGLLHARGGLLNTTGKGAPWHCSAPGNCQVVAIDLPGVTFAEPWWLQYVGRCGELDPPLGNRLVDAATSMAKNLAAKVPWGGWTWPLFYPISFEIVSVIAAVWPFLDNYKGPTAPKEKDGWWTGL